MPKSRARWSAVPERPPQVDCRLGACKRQVQQPSRRTASCGPASEGQTAGHFSHFTISMLTMPASRRASDHSSVYICRRCFHSIWSSTGIGCKSQKMSCASTRITVPDASYMPVIKIDAKPAASIRVDRDLDDLVEGGVAAYITFPALLNATPFAPKGGVRPVPGPSSGSLLHATGVPPVGPAFQMTPLKSPDT